MLVARWERDRVIWRLPARTALVTLQDECRGIRRASRRR